MDNEFAESVVTFVRNYIYRGPEWTLRMHNYVLSFDCIIDPPFSCGINQDFRVVSDHPLVCANPKAEFPYIYETYKQFFGTEIYDWTISSVNGECSFTLGEFVGDTSDPWGRKHLPKYVLPAECVDQVNTIKKLEIARRINKGKFGTSPQ